MGTRERCERQPFVVAATIAKNRAWALPRWHGSLVGQTPTHPRALYVLNNDSSDDTAACLLDAPQPADVTLVVETLNTGDQGCERTSGSAPRYSIANLALLRNEMIARVLSLWPNLTHLLSVDSDIACDPNVLALLLAARLPIVSAVVRNSPTQPVYNFWRGWVSPFGGPSYPHRDGSEERALAENSPVIVSMTGACVLIERAVLDDERVRYAAHPQGEDIPFSVAAQRAGWLMAVHPKARTTHMLSRDGVGAR